MSGERPSVFISYASEDRAAARALRDTLAAAGLEVWYDENELAGGDAWDQKIRRQIRDCDYFLPVISANTERRKEGYFRREWRLAVERTMDMADDVLFLVPVAIDDTIETSARVPDKFVGVQWLRTPGGQATPALQALTRRLLAGEHTVVTRPPLVARAPLPPTTPPPLASAAPHAAPPVMPSFPHPPEKGGGHWIKYGAEVFWWALTVVWMLFGRLPKWGRSLIIIWLVFTIIGLMRTLTSSPSPKKKASVSDDDSPAAVEKAVETALTAALNLKGARANPTASAIAAVPFAPLPNDEAASKFGHDLFGACYAKLIIARRRDNRIAPPAPDGADESLVASGRKAGAAFAWGGRIEGTGEQKHFAARLLRVADGALLWSGNFSLADGQPEKAGGELADAVLAAAKP